MSWQSALACWYLRRQFRPATQRTEINVERARALTAKRAWSPKVPAGWRLREQYGAGETLRGEWFEPLGAKGGRSGNGGGSAEADSTVTPTILYLHGGGYYFCSPRSHRSHVFGLAMR
ncbi:MAG: alpha/beta hydrolase, partial [Paraburkholderia sp.]